MLLYGMEWFSWASFLLGILAGQCLMALVIGLLAVASRRDIPEEKEVPEKTPDKIRRVK